MPVPLLATVVVEGDGLPAPEWRCRRCDGPEAHACTGRFRVNANGRVLDVWLLYRCGRCGATRKLPVAERVAVGSVDLGALDAAAVARDLARLRRAGASVVGDRFRVSPVVPWDGSAVRLELVFPEPLAVRLADVTAASLGTSRSELRRLARSGRVTLDGGWSAARSLRTWSAATVTLA